MAAVFGWSNIAYYSSVLSYIGFWIVLSAGLIAHKLYLRRRKALGYTDEDDENRIGFKTRVRMAIFKGANDMKSAMFNKKKNSEFGPDKGGRENDAFVVAH